MSIQEDLVAFCLKELNNRQSRPYTLTNEELAEEVYNRAARKYPYARLIKHGRCQYILVSERGQRALLKRLKKRKEEHEQAIAEIDATLAAVGERKEEK